jgi:hypothetical protein
MNDNAAPTPHLHCRAVEEIFQRASQFFPKDADSLMVTAYVNGACAILAAQVIASTNRSIANEHMQLSLAQIGTAVDKINEPKEGPGPSSPPFGYGDKKDSN